MARTKATSVVPPKRSAIATKTSHKGAFVRVAPTTSSSATSNKGGEAPAPATATTKASKKKSSGIASVKKTKKPSSLGKVHRFRPGTVALRNIKRLQSSTNNLIPKAVFYRIVKEAAQAPLDETPRFRKEALMALQDGVEAATIKFLESSNLAAIHGRRVTVMPKDLALIRRIHSS
eukprot:PhF_6_TR19580/c1_g1_i1/m.28547/K11253/H3; histone H3